LLALPGDGVVRFSCGGVSEQAMSVREAADAPVDSLSRPRLRTRQPHACGGGPRRRRGGDGLLRASMNGRVIALLAAEGDAVAAGQPLVTLEAMKMEHVHCAPRAGRVAALHVAVGAQVAARHVVAEIADA
jgi:geranyl-CoA carboxylase alpha subunit